MATDDGSLLHELKIIWDEIGESETERSKILLQIKQECLEVYKRKVDQAKLHRAQLQKEICTLESVVTDVCSILGEPQMHIQQCNRNTRSLKEELKLIGEQLNEMRKKKDNRKDQFLKLAEQIKKILIEIRPKDNPTEVIINDADLSIGKLEELNKQLQLLEIEKADRLKQVADHLNTINSLCLVLGTDFNQIIKELEFCFSEIEGPKNISDDAIEMLVSQIQKLREVKRKRIEKLQDLATTMLELWHLMDTPIEEQQKFLSVTCNIAASEHEIAEPNALSIGFINNVGTEVMRLEELKASKMKELVAKKKIELEELRKRAHVVEAKEIVDPSMALEQIELQISITKEEAFSRKEILERVEKWLAACDEESWLEEYNRDENRYTGRGVHLALKRAEKARILVSKIPAMVEALVAKTTAWEMERGTKFIYDGARLLTMLNEYTTLRQDKEQERKRQREQKRLHGITEQETFVGAKSSSLKNLKKVTRTFSAGHNRSSSLGGVTQPLQSLRPDSPLSTKSPRSARKSDEGIALPTS
ncbi:65-kDa microtubule-associated protein 3-like isoform X1 [Ananas comosus]|uniref:65-kDa microtubule-associated protein 3-like isoform X1 n=1 Tax=Ananas comosus TaxID=4615 RepID=A0A6P5HBM0_ANACO|nr:65-kDa microtubule-associated protein 3-like isoform X1 [Ananas comosus]